MQHPKPLSDDQSAVLFGTTVFTNANHAEVRQRYSGCHEITHTFFPDRDTGPVFTRSGKQDPDAEVEYLCQVGAAELLMPHWCFGHLAAQLPFGLHSAFRLAESYAASPEAALRRLVDFAGRPAAAVFLMEGYRKAEHAALQQRLLPGLEPIIPSPAKKLRIARRSHTSPEMRKRRIYFPWNKSVPESSVCQAALQARRAGAAGIHSAKETWEIEGLGECYVEAVAWLERDDLPAGGMCLLWQ